MVGIKKDNTVQPFLNEFILAHQYKKSAVDKTSTVTFTTF